MLGHRGRPGARHEQPDLAGPGRDRGRRVRRREQLTLAGQRDRRDAGYAVERERDVHGPVGAPLAPFACAVERVDDPDSFLLESGGGVLRLFRQHGVVRACAGQPGEDQVVAEPITLVLGRLARLELEQEVARLACDVGRELVIVHSVGRRLVGIVVEGGGLGGRGREQWGRRASEDSRVDRLHEREIDVGAACDERVVAAIEEEQDARAG